MGFWTGVLTLFCCTLSVMMLIAFRWLLRRRRRRLALIVIAANLAVPAVVIILHGKDVQYAGGLAIIAAIALMAELILCLLVYIAALLRFLWRRMLREPFDGGHRRVLKGAVCYPVAALALGSYGSLYERNHQVLHEISVPVADGRLYGYRIAQLSDVHIGMFFSLGMLRNLLEKAAAEKPDVLVITGDLFDDEEMNERTAKIVDSFSERFKDGIYFIRGNHEHYRNMNATERYIKSTHIHELVNGAREVRPGLWFVGVEYPMDRPHFGKLEHEFARQAFSHVPDGALSVLLAHHPDFIDDGRQYGARLVLTGHTHGGQFGVLGVPVVPHVFKYMRGIYDFGETMGYVHTGNGSWCPMRIGCPPEIAVFRFTARK